jgi:hypothetical protein
MKNAGEAVGVFSLAREKNNMPASVMPLSTPVA